MFSPQPRPRTGAALPGGDALVARQDRTEDRGRITDSVETALKLADGVVEVVRYGETETTHLFSERYGCPECGISMPEMTPRAFSFNSPHGACPECQGLGAVYDFDPARLEGECSRRG